MFSRLSVLQVQSQTIDFEIEVTQYLRLPKRKAGQRLPEPTSTVTDLFALHNVMSKIHDYFL